MEYLFGETRESDLAGGQFNAAYDKAFALLVARQGVGLPTILDLFGKERAMQDAINELRRLADAYIDTALQRRLDNSETEKYELSSAEKFVFLDSRSILYERRPN